jgi:hypothetical protein
VRCTFASRIIKSYRSCFITNYEPAQAPRPISSQTLPNALSVLNPARKRLPEPHFYAIMVAT